MAKTKIEPKPEPKLEAPPAPNPAAAAIAPPVIGDRVMILAPSGVSGLQHLHAYRAEVISIHPQAPTTISVRVLDGGIELNGLPLMDKAAALKLQRGNTWWR